MNLVAIMILQRRKTVSLSQEYLEEVLDRDLGTRFQCLAVQINEPSNETINVQNPALKLTNFKQHENLLHSSVEEQSREASTKGIDEWHDEDIVVSVTKGEGTMVTMWLLD